MDFFWVYDIPNWMFFMLTIVSFSVFCCLGAFFFNDRFEKYLGLTKEHNEIIAIFLSISGVLYGVTLGLLAVGTFENFNEVEDKVQNEASALAGIYRDVNMLEGDPDKLLPTSLKKYTKYVIEEAWPSQRKGLIAKGGTKIINDFQLLLSNYKPVNEKDFIVFGEVFDQYNVLIEKRRLRLNAVNTNLPGTIYLILFIGAFVNIIFTWLLVIKNKKLDYIINTLIGILLGSLIFLIASMDNPFRGEYSVGSESFELIYKDLMGG